MGAYKNRPRQENQDLRTIHRKDSDYPAEKQLIAPCVSCQFWNTCGPWGYTDCHRFGVFITAYKSEKWLRKRAEKETNRRDAK